MRHDMAKLLTEKESRRDFLHRSLSRVRTQETAALQERVAQIEFEKHPSVAQPGRERRPHKTRVLGSNPSGRTKVCTVSSGAEPELYILLVGRSNRSPCTNS